MLAHLIRPVADGVLLLVRVTPGARREGLALAADGPDGALRLKAAVTAPPEKGKANTAVVKLAAKAWRLPKTSLSVASGAQSRDKTLHIAGDPQTITAALAEWAAAALNDNQGG